MGKGCGAGASIPLLSPPLVPYPWGRLLKKNNKRIKKKNPKKKKINPPGLKPFFLWTFQLTEPLTSVYGLN